MTAALAFKLWLGFLAAVLLLGAYLDSKKGKP